jgi:hypothetical protein
MSSHIKTVDVLVAAAQLKLLWIIKHTNKNKIENLVICIDEF